MSSSILLFFFLSLFFISSTSSSSSSINTTHKCSVQQTLDLLLFKQNLSSINDTLFEYDSECEDWLGSGYNPIMVNWNTGTDCCEWSGVTCDDSTGDVIGLDLSCGMLQGTIHPNSTLFHLPRLQRLSLAYNNFTHSQLPPAIGRLSNSLTHLNISGCWFTGQVPTDISHLHKLVSLDLSLNGNDLKLEPRVFIKLLQNLTVMKELSLRNVNISAVLPTNLNISSALKLLNLGFTRLQGNLPRNIFNLQSLENLDLSFNSFTGHVRSDKPSDISLPKLVRLDLSQNENLLIQPRFFSILFKNSTFLRDLLLLGVNCGSASLPTYINISSLRSLDLSASSLQGKLPDNVLSLKYLEELHLSYNKNLSGPLPKVNTSTSIPLRSLVLLETSLSGEIPTSIGYLKSLVVLDLSDCGLNGSLPKSLGNLRYLEALVLYNNMLSGEIPSSIGHLESLIDLDLSSCGLNGSLPKSLGNLRYLELLYLSNNKLSGTLSSSLFTLVKDRFEMVNLPIDTRRVG